MPIVKQGETQPLTLKECNPDGVMINVYLKAAVANTAIDASDFFANQVGFKAVLSRDKGKLVVAQDNLKNLGIYSAKQFGAYEWFRGSMVVYPEAGVKAELLLSLYIPFGGVLNIKGQDVFNWEMVAGRQCFSADIDASQSFIEYDFNPGIGYEIGTPQITCYNIQADNPVERFTLGDNVIKIMLINYDKDNIKDNVITSCDLSSDKLSLSMNFYDLINRDRNMLTPPSTKYRYGNTQPVTGGNEAFPYLPLFPQTFVLFASPIQEKMSLDNCVVSFQYTAGNLTAGNNYLMYTRYNVTAQTLEKAKLRATKHNSEQLEKIATAAPAVS